MKYPRTAIVWQSLELSRLCNGPKGENDLERSSDLVSLNFVSRES